MLSPYIGVMLIAFYVNAFDSNDAQVIETRAIRAMRQRRETVNRIETINQAFDAAVRPLQSLLHMFKLDPIHAPDQNIQILGGLGTCDLTHIKVYNVSTIKRHGDMYLLEHVESRKLDVVIPLTFQQLLIISNFKAGTPLLIATGLVTALVKGSIIDLQITFDYPTAHLDLSKFNIATLGQITTHFDENALSFALNAASPLFIAVFEGVIQYIVEGPIANEIKAFLNATNTEISSILHKFRS